MPRPSRPPIGLHLARTARSVSRAFDDALAQAGGSVPRWLVLISLKTQPVRNQRELAEAVGIREATLTHHLNSMDEEGLITRRRDPANRRVQLVELTEVGGAAAGRVTIGHHRPAVRAAGSFAHIGERYAWRRRRAMTLAPNPARPVLGRDTRRPRTEHQSGPAQRRFVAGHRALTRNIVP